jgi:3'-phosphoadenosine 5'-phosphosulfate (PAPS) 3'-phosphatase
MGSLPGFLKKSVATSLGVAILGTQCLFAYQPENGFWAERRRVTKRGSSPLLASLPLGAPPLGSNALSGPFPTAQSVEASLSQTVAHSVPKGFLKEHSSLFSALSPAHGTIRKVSLPKHVVPGAPVVIHIQDVHMNRDAQWNIREAVRSCIQSGQVDLVALEGATQPIDLQPFVDYPHRRAVEATADYLLKQNKITGPVHAAFTATRALPKIIGIDDPIHYAANVRAYTDSSVRLEKTRHEVKALEEDIEGRKKKVYSLPLAAFDEQVRSYQKGETSLGAYVVRLTEQVGDSGEPTLRSFLSALALERTLDLHRVEVERAALIAALTQRLDERATQELFAQSLAYRTGQCRYADFYRRLKETCQSKGLPLSHFPGMEAYVRYVLTADGIDGDRLLEEIAELEKRGYDRMAKSNKEKALVAESRRARLVEKLVDFSLTPAEWKEYQATGPVGTKAEWGSFESFYREAHARDGAMTENLLKAIRGDGPASVRTAILVTGGYHAEGMRQRLVQQGVVVISYVPKIGKIDTAQGSAYLSVFTQEKTPMEKLFAGQKLFLGDNPFKGVPEAALVVPVIARMDSSNKSGISEGERAKLTGYLNRYHKGATVTVDAPSRTAGGGWVASVRLRLGDEEKYFSLKTNERFDIESFGLINREERPPFAWLAEASIPIHRWLGQRARDLSPWTEAHLFAGLSFWTPANFLWFARRHDVRNERDLSFLLSWMAVHSFVQKIERENPYGVAGRLRNMVRQFDSHRFWNGSGLFPLAVKKEGEPEKPETQRRAPYRGKPGFKELKILGSNSMERVLNGQRDVIFRAVLVWDGKYLLLNKEEKGTGRLKLDIPGGGAAGEAAGISVPEGALREFFEELKLKLNRFFKRSVDVSLATRQYRIFSIPGPNDAPEKRRATIFRKIDLGNEKRIPIKLSKEHKKNPLWLSLSEVLDRFPELNTGPKMALYLEFLWEAYGIKGVRSLIPLNQIRRLKTLTDPVLIESDEGWFLWSPNGDGHVLEEMDALGLSLEIVEKVDRVSKKKSVLEHWPNPQATQESEGRITEVPMGLWRLKKNESSPAIRFSETPAALIPEDRDALRKRRGAEINYLVEKIPPSIGSVASHRLLVKWRDQFVFLHVPDHKNECVGGAGLSSLGLKRIIAEQLGIPAESIVEFRVSPKPLLTHAVMKSGGPSYFSVSDGVVTIDNEASMNAEGLLILSYAEMKQRYSQFTLATRMAILKEVIQKEYGFTVESVTPLTQYREGPLHLLQMKTNKGDVVFRKASTFADIPNEAIPVLKKPDGTNGFYVKFGGMNFILTKHIRIRRYRKARRLLNDTDSSPRGDVRIRHLRGIAQGVRHSEIWADLLKAQCAIVEQKKSNPEMFLKSDNSPVTEWDYRLQLAFLKMVKDVFPQAHVVGEENLLNENFLNTLPDDDRLLVKDLVLKNGENVPEGLLFFVDPIDGTRCFSEGGDDFAFTFGVLEEGKPLYAATYMPAASKRILYEAIPEHKTIYRDGVAVPPLRDFPSTVYVQRMLRARWEAVSSNEFPNANFNIPSIAVRSAQMAATKEGSAMGLVLNPEGVFPWDFVPASIFLTVAGYSVVGFNGQPVLRELRRLINRGVPPRQLMSQVLVAPPEHLKTLLKTVAVVLQAQNAPGASSGRATSRWMATLFERGGAAVDGTVRLLSPKANKSTGALSYKHRFGLHYIRNAPRYELVLAMGAMAANLFWGATPWGGGLFSLWFVLIHTRLFEPETDVPVGWVKVVCMAVIYGTLIAFTSEVIVDIFFGETRQTLAPLLLGGGWAGAYGLHRRFDLAGRAAKQANPTKVEMEPHRSEPLRFPRLFMGREDVLSFLRSADDRDGPRPIPEKEIPRRLLRNLEERPLLLGVEDIRAKIHHVAENYSRRPGSRTVGGESPFAFLGDGVKLHFIDSVSLATPGNVDKLRRMMEKDADYYIVTDHSIPSLPEKRVFVWGASFPSVGGLFEVPLSDVPVPLRELMRDRPLRVLKTPLLALNTDGLKEDDPLREASKTAWVFAVELMRVFPAEAFQWDDVWRVFRAFTESA